MYPECALAGKEGPRSTYVLQRDRPLHELQPGSSTRCSIVAEAFTASHSFCTFIYSATKFCTNPLLLFRQKVAEKVSRLIKSYGIEKAAFQNQQK